MVNKDLGMVTAYAYAVSKGYTGTEEEFAELMADYAEVGERAEAAATAAAASATAASGSASDSAASATAAEGFAGNASTSAGNAAQSASQASQSATAASGSATAAAGSATQAAGSATTAGNKATEAAQSATAAAGSATAAGQSATAAQTAQGAAETAQTAAETAQGAAEDAAESVSATLITDEASGAIATFPDGADGVPMRSVVVDMEPIQDLHGQDAPYPGGGGKNKWEFASSYSGNGNLAQNLTFSSPLASGDYTLSSKGTFASGGAIQFRFIYADATTKNVNLGYNKTGSTYYVTITFEQNVTGVEFLYSNNAGNSITKLQLESGSTFTDYAPYSNICPISGRSEVRVWRSGKNINPNEGVEITLSTSIRFYAKAGDYVFSTGNGNNMTGGETLYISVFDSQTGGNNITDGAITSDRMTLNGSKTLYYSVTGFSNIPFTVNNPGWIACGFNNQYPTNYTTFQIERGLTATAYEPYDGQSITIQLGQTVYGGTVDAVSGVMTVDRAMVDLGTLNWEYQGVSSGRPYGRFNTTSQISDMRSHSSGDYSSFILCSEFKPGNTPITSQNVDNIVAANNKKVYINCSLYTDAASFKTAMNGVQLCYELATPVTIQLSAQQLTTILGTNNVWSDGGNVSVEYVADTKAYIAKVIAAALA